MSEIVTHRRTRQLKGQLTDLNLRDLTTRERPYKVADGNGLHVLVSPTGLRAWRWKYRFAGREKVLPLGRYPDVSLAHARAAQDEARKKVLAGIDPSEERLDAKQALLTAPHVRQHRRGCVSRELTGVATWQFRPAPLPPIALANLVL